MNRALIVRSTKKRKIQPESESEERGLREESKFLIAQCTEKVHLRDRAWHIPQNTTNPKRETRVGCRGSWMNHSETEAEISRIVRLDLNSGAPFLVELNRVIRTFQQSQKRGRRS